jgi:hypothetical protein
VHSAVDAGLNAESTASAGLLLDDDGTE